MYEKWRQNDLGLAQNCPISNKQEVLNTNFPTLVEVSWTTFHSDTMNWNDNQASYWASGWQVWKTYFIHLITLMFNLLTLLTHNIQYKNIKKKVSGFF